MLFGTSGTAQALAPEGAQPAVIGAVRLAVGGIFLLIVTSLQRQWPVDNKWPRAAIFCAAACMAAVQLFFFEAISRVGVALGTTLFIGSYPIFAGLLELLVRREWPRRRWLLSTTLAIGGCSLLLGGGNSDGGDFIGVLLALGAGSSYAIYASLVKSLLNGRSTVAVTAVVSSYGAVLLSPLLFTADLAWLPQPDGIAISLYLGVAAAAAPYCLFAQGVKSVPVSTAATLSLAEPLTAGLLGVFFLGEHLSPQAIVGMGLLIGSLALLTITPKFIAFKPVN